MSHFEYESLFDIAVRCIDRQKDSSFRKTVFHNFIQTRKKVKSHKGVRSEKGPLELLQFLTPLQHRMRNMQPQMKTFLDKTLYLYMQSLPSISIL